MPTSPQHARHPSLSLRLPAAILRFWTHETSGASAPLDAEIFRLTKGFRGFHLPAPGTLAFTPESGDPAIFDTALRTGEQLLKGEGRREPSLRVLILPAEATLQNGKLELGVDLLLDKAPRWFASLEPGLLHATGWVVRMLEQHRAAREIATARGPIDQQFPILQVGSRLPETRPWRNAEILNRRISTISRPGLIKAGQELLGEPAWRIEGPLGCGKSHLAHQILQSAEAPRLWLRGEPSHRRTGSLARQIVSQLQAASTDTSGGSLVPRLSNPGMLEKLRRVAESGAEEIAARSPAEELSAVVTSLAGGSDRTFFVVVDDLEQLATGDKHLLAEMLSFRGVGQKLRLLLIGRSGCRLPEALVNLPTLTVEAFDEREMNEFSQQLFTGLSLPSSTQSRLQIATQGCPFALEEGMIALIREKNLRRVYGSFFFAGQETTGFSPSPRLRCHLEAEAYRLGLEAPLHLLSLVESGVPAPFLNEPAGRLGGKLSEGWEASAKASGLLEDVKSPWGPAVGFSCPAYGATLAEGMSPDSLQSLRVALGTTLAHASSSGKALWEGYRLLRGTPEAMEPLLRTVESSYAARIPGNVLLEVLTQEIYRHRERQGDSETELRLLWKLLPLARKLGRLNEFTADLKRSVDLAHDQPRRLLALAGLKAEMDQDAGRYEEAESTIRLALQAARGGDERRQALLLIQLGRLQLDQERYGEATELFGKLVDQLDRSGLEALAASCRYYLGNIAFHEGNYEEALELHREALERRRRQNLNRVAGNSLTAMGAVYLSLGNYPEALRSYREAQELLEKHGGDTDRAFPLLGLGRALNLVGDYATASRTLRQALALREGKDDVAGEAVARLAVAENHLFLGQLDRAQEEATKAHFQLNLLARKTLLADAEQILGRIQARLRQLDSAKSHLKKALEYHRELGNNLAAANDIAYLLELALKLEDEDDVARHTLALQEAIERLARPEFAERLHFRLYQGFEWLNLKGRSTEDPQPCLERAYRELFRKASHLNPELRHHFLFQVSDYRDIIETAARAGLSTDVSDQRSLR